MSEILLTIINVGIPAFISIIGFIVTNSSMKQSFKNELDQNRDTVALEKMTNIPYEVLVLFDNMIDVESFKNKKQRDVKQEENLKSFKKLMNTIFSYGSLEAIKIASLMQKENYKAALKEVDQDQYRMMSIYILLATQIKYDVTSVAVNPKYWFEMRITDFSTEERKFAEANNKLVDDLGLSSKFKIEVS